MKQKIFIAFIFIVLLIVVIGIMQGTKNNSKNESTNENISELTRNETNEVLVSNSLGIIEVIPANNM